MSLNRTGRIAAAERHGYEAIQTLQPLPPGEFEALTSWFDKHVAGPLGLVVDTPEYGRAWAVALESWRACLEHGWKVGRRDALEAMAR